MNRPITIWFLLFSGLTTVTAAAQESLALSTELGHLIHNATYTTYEPPPDWWPPELPWYGEGQNDDPSYRYGPALIRYNNDNLHFWACSEGDANVADYIRYRHSNNGGKTWGEEVIALGPTIGSPDGWAICDPNVIKVGSYFYLAYTATDSSFGAGLNNQVFVARSLYPDREFHKWNGSGWGGIPQPIIAYNGPTNAWGLGEPNMVVKGNTLYLYYTEDIGIASTRVATAQINNSNWPDTLVDRGYAIPVRDFYEDQTDVKYLPQVDRFIATAVASRFMPTSYIHVWQSTDGLRFTPVANDNIKANLQPNAHNMGMSGNYLGHARMGSKEYVAYSYTAPDGAWGIWNAWLNPVTISGAGWVQSPNLTPILMLLLDE